MLQYNTYTTSSYMLHDTIRSTHERTASYVPRRTDGDSGTSRLIDTFQTRMFWDDAAPGNSPETVTAVHGLADSGFVPRYLAQWLLCVPLALTSHSSPEA